MSLRACRNIIVPLTVLLLRPALLRAQADSTAALQNLTLRTIQKKDPFSGAAPAQVLERSRLQQLNAPTVGDAARYFSGVQLKDYGGIGGLKTVSVRSLGAAHTAVMYDGLPVSDAQSGQTDLSRFSSSFVQSLQLQNGGPVEGLHPARAYAASSLLTIQTVALHPSMLREPRLQANIRGGSFGFLQAGAGGSLPLSTRTAISAQGEALFSRGDYPFFINNGNRSEKSRRQNGDIRSLQGEINLAAEGKDSGLLTIKLWAYDSERGLPGAIVFFNDRSVQRLQNRDYFAQARYRRSWSKTAVLLSGKFNSGFTRYRDPDFLNGSGGLNQRYLQREGYVSLAFQYRPVETVQFSVASDGARTGLNTNTTTASYPQRTSFWNAATVSFQKKAWLLHANLLHHSIHDKRPAGNASAQFSRLLPSAALSYHPEKGPWLLRTFYKQVFRMPTFNDLYYNFTGNSNLRPEAAQQLGAGIVYKPLNSHKVFQPAISIDAYANRISDKIIALPNRNLFVWTMLNLGEVSIRGLDLTAEWNGRLLNDWSWSGRVAYTYQQALDVTDPASSMYRDRIPYTPDHSGSGLLSVSWKQWTAGYNFLFSGTRYALGENNPFNELDGWGLHDAFVERRMQLAGLEGTLKMELSNLTNSAYDIVRYYPMPGRSFFISLFISFQ